MKKILFIIGILILSGCAHRADQLGMDEYKAKEQEFYITNLQDSCKELNRQIVVRDSVILSLQDSIVVLRNNAMTEENFIRAYKYERLYKYYRICKKDNSQWKYYRGWSIRVFENE